MVSSQWSVVSDRAGVLARAGGIEQRAVGGEWWEVGDGQWEVDDGQWEVGGRWEVVESGTWKVRRETCGIEDVVDLLNKLRCTLKLTRRETPPVRVS